MSLVAITENPQARDRGTPKSSDRSISLLKFMNLLGITETKSGRYVDNLPFVAEDVTAGTETELQVAVVGKRQDVDLAQAIETSCYFKNMIKRTASGDAPKKALAALENYLEASENVWENSWVRFPRNLLNGFARTVFNNDLRADKRIPSGPKRCDANRFMPTKEGDGYIRVPISYLLKLSLAQAIGQPDVPPVVRRAGKQMMGHFLNDNTSPETHSFYPVSGDADRTLGTAVADETLLRYLLTQLLIQYANQRLGLRANGQQAEVYFAPHPPVRQRQLNALISDAFYRELFMSPCLSGWDRGEAKHRYMVLCHEVLSRSQLNTLSKLKECGIIGNNLVVLPNTSNVCLANNGTHLSLGSRALSKMVDDAACAYSHIDEKYFGDLAIKIQEHFLPLFVGTYSAAPYRFDFSDLHPERVLGFLPHELDYTHLRMLWRRWKKKACIRFMGYPITPFGPEWLDRLISAALGLRGDLVLDYRLIDYLVALLSTDESPSLDGSYNNDSRLKADLTAMGVFDDRMPLYSLIRLRQQAQVGFSGYEARYYSLFERFGQDMRAATDLQHLITLLAYKYIFHRYATHAHIPDNPTVESERRQLFFGSAIGIPTFYIHKRSPNRLLAKILELGQGIRASHRYHGYLRITGLEYRRALCRLLRRDAHDLIEMLGLEETVNDLEARINRPRKYAAADRLAAEVTGGRRGKPMRCTALEFNLAAETYYRTTLRQRHTQEGFEVFRKAVAELDSWQSWRSGAYNRALLQILEGKNAVDYVTIRKRAFLDGSLPAEACERMIYLVLLVCDQGRKALQKNDHG